MTEVTQMMCGACANENAYKVACMLYKVTGGVGRVQCWVARKMHSSVLSPLHCSFSLILTSLILFPFILVLSLPIYISSSPSFILFLFLHFTPLLFLFLFTSHFISLSSPFCFFPSSIYLSVSLSFPPFLSLTLLTIILVHFPMSGTRERSWCGLHGRGDHLEFVQPGTWPCFRKCPSTRSWCSSFFAEFFYFFW